MADSTEIRNIPEIRSLDARRELIRIPPELDVPLTPRIRRLMDTRAFRRLRHISQLSLVSLVYPAAQHTRLEHSLGVYRLSLLVLRHLSHQPGFSELVDARSATRFILAALLHDLGHWPFAHIVEDLHIPGVATHEEVAIRHLNTPEVDSILRNEFDVSPDEVATLIDGHAIAPEDHTTSLLHSILSGPIDIDKMDYLLRDSLHAGVPYGRNYDQPRLLASLCLNRDRNGIAISEKGRTAAEMLVFARYVMFSEVYWHHAVRSATAMFQRAVWRLQDQISMSETMTSGDTESIASLRRVAQGTSAASLLAGLFGDHRRLYKRGAQFSPFENPEIFFRIAGHSYPWLVQLGERISRRISVQIRQELPPDAILIDAPPSHSETAVHVEIFSPDKSDPSGVAGQYRSLETVSPIIRTLAGKGCSDLFAGRIERFDDYVKKVRFLVSPKYVEQIRAIPNLISFIQEALAEKERSP